MAQCLQEVLDLRESVGDLKLDEKMGFFVVVNMKCRN